MRFSVHAERISDGTLAATLLADGERVDTKSGLKDTGAVDKWAKGVAADFHRDNLPDPHKVLTYDHTFSL